MKRLVCICLVLGLTGLWAGAARAEGVPWERPEAEAPKDKPGEAVAAEPPVPKRPAVDLKAVLKPQQYQRAIKPILVQIEQAKKVLALSAKEMAKPEKRRNEKRAMGHRERAAKFYLAASLRARQTKNYIARPEHRDAILAQYDKPTRKKAVAIYLDLAESYMQKRDVKRAIAYYRQVLKIDRENTAAKEELKKIQKAVQGRLAEREKGRAQQGGSKDEDETRPLERDETEWTETEHENQEADEHEPQDYEDKYSGKKKYKY